MSQNKIEQKKGNSTLVTALLLAAVGIIVIAIVSGIVIAQNQTTTNVNTVTAEDTVTLDKVKRSNEVTNFVRIDVKNYGSFVIELYPDVAPITVDNFKKMVSDGVYNGTTFHRVKKNFVIQGGIPADRSKKIDTIKGEFYANGVINDLKHERGVISMARANPYDSASSQFFILHQTSPQLDGSYAAFGKLLFGYNTLDMIANVPCSGETPNSTITVESAYFVTVDN